MMKTQKKSTRCWWYTNNCKWLSSVWGWVEREGIFLAAFFAIIPAIYSNLFKKDIEIPFIPYLVLGFYWIFFLN